MLDVSIKVKNYKCFGDKPQGFDKIYPINIIIGKNNSGKSSLIDLIQYAIEFPKEFVELSTERPATQVLISAFADEQNIWGNLQSIWDGIGLTGDPELNELIRKFKGQRFTYSIWEKRATILTPPYLGKEIFSQNIRPVFLRKNI